MTNRMRAISQDVLGGPEVLKVIETDRPEPGPTEVLVRVHAAGLNPTDWKHRATGGILVSLVLSRLVDMDAEASGVRHAVMLVEPDHAAMKEIAALAGAGRLRAELDTVLPLQEAAKAHERGESGRTTGKIVLTTAP